MFRNFLVIKQQQYQLLPALVSQVMRPKVIVVNLIERVERIYEILRSNRHHAFPVVDDFDARLSDDEHFFGNSDHNSPHHHSYRRNFGRLRGIVLRYQLITLLQHKVGFLLL